MNYMVIGPCIITFLLIANSLLVFYEKYPLYFDFIYYVMFFSNSVFVYMYISGYQWLWCLIF